MYVCMSMNEETIKLFCNLQHFLGIVSLCEVEYRHPTLVSDLPVQPSFALVQDHPKFSIKSHVSNTYLTQAMCPWWTAQWRAVRPLESAREAFDEVFNKTFQHKSFVCTATSTQAG